MAARSCPAVRGPSPGALNRARSGAGRCGPLVGAGGHARVFRRVSPPLGSCSWTLRWLFVPIPRPVERIRALRVLREAYRRRRKPPIEVTYRTVNGSTGRTTWLAGGGVLGASTIGRSIHTSRPRVIHWVGVGPGGRVPSAMIELSYGEHSAVSGDTGVSQAHRYSRTRSYSTEPVTRKATANATSTVTSTGSR